MVVFDSTRPIGAGRAVYLLATGERMPDEQLEQCADVACRARFPEQSMFPLDKLRSPAALRLYRAQVIPEGVGPVNGWRRPFHVPG